MGFNIGPTLAVNGEKEYQNAMKAVRESMKYVQAEAAAATSAFGKNDTSIKALTTRHGELKKALGVQKDAVKAAEDALQRMKDKGIDPSNQSYKRMESNLSNAKAALNNTKNEMAELNKTARDEAVEKFSKGIKASAVALGALAVAAGAAAIKMGKEVIKQFGELEQNLGGSEAVFGEYAKSIQKSGEEAYKNLGVSQSEYLATANKMGALFQGSGIAQQESLSLTEKAMQRAADMASVMGIDMSMAMESVAGAAKGNYTMMDNLGVKMDNTSIKAYAMANGFKGAWSEVSNADKAQYAMQMFFDSTEQYAGNFAKESTQTITGSIGMMKAAFGSFVAGLGNSDADIKNLTRNMVDAFKTVVKNITPVIENFTAVLPEVFAEVLPAISGILPSLLDVVISLFRQVLNTIITMMPELIPVVVEILLAVVDALIANLPLLIDGATQLILALASGLILALPQLIPAVVETVMAIVNALIDNISLLIDASIELMVALGLGLIEALPKLIERVPEIIEKLVVAIVKNGWKLIAAAGELIWNLAYGLTLKFQELLAKVGGWVNDSIIQPIKDKVNAFVDIGKNLVTGIWNGISNAATWLWNKVKGWCGDLVGKIKGFFGIKSPSKLFAGFGENMALGLGIGFGDEMKTVAQQMIDAVPTTFNVNGAYGMGGAYGRGGVVVNMSNSFTGYKTRDGVAAARDLNRQLGMAY